jgi:hypothetical protein
MLKLVRKSNAVFQAFKHVFDSELSGAANLNQKEILLFNSMERQHRNSHITPEDWLNAFDQIKSKLGTKETQKDLSEKFALFLDSKFAGSLEKQFSTPEIMDHLEDPVWKYYKSLLDERDQVDDEFDFSLGGEIKQDDIFFFTRRFYPTALLLSYSLLHHMVEPTELMGEVFTIGYGSKTYSLFPEICGVCFDCISERFQSEKLQKLSPEQIRLYNQHILKAQQKDWYAIGKYQSDSSSDEESTPVDKTAAKESPATPTTIRSSDKQSLFEFNPFIVNTDINSSDSNVGGSKCDSNTLQNVGQDLSTHACSYCGKTFSKEVFVGMHVEIFHQTSKKVVPKFVCDGEDLMTTFVNSNDTDNSQQIINVKKTLKRSKKK